MSEKTYTCSRCQAQLRDQRVDFTYLGHIFHADLPCCPKCGMVFIPQDVAEGKMAEVEAMLEEK